MKKICILTTTRAEYGLLKPVIKKLLMDRELDVRVAVTGAHLSSDFGLTYKQIENDDIIIDCKICMMIKGDTPAGITKSMANALIGFAEYFETSRPDLLVVLGDRYETLAVCIAAMNERIPIAHLYGGETTEGAVDESIRHAITKMSHLHFTSTLAYKKRVIQLGENPDNVYYVGSTGCEAIGELKLMSKSELEESIAFKLNKKTALLTYHPVTLEDNSFRSQFEDILSALDGAQLNIIFTKANADVGGKIINDMIDDYVKCNSERTVAFSSLGQIRYFSALKFVDFVIGNSSSGIIEAASFHIPTVNIGDRQKGRISADSVIDCYVNRDDIASGIKKALSEEFKYSIKDVENPYQKNGTSDKIVSIIKERLVRGIDIKKKFYDIEVGR